MFRFKDRLPESIMTNFVYFSNVVAALQLMLDGVTVTDKSDSANMLVYPPVQVNLTKELWSMHPLLRHT